MLTCFISIGESDVTIESKKLLIFLNVDNWANNTKASERVDIPREIRDIPELSSAFMKLYNSYDNQYSYMREILE
jgi:hypothetical protein